MPALRLIWRGSLWGRPEAHQTPVQSPTELSPHDGTPGYFAALPALQARSWATALSNGALLGLVAYGTYDINNLLMLKNSSILVSAVDMA